MYDIWKMDAINELQEHNFRKQALINIPSKLNELEAAITGIRSASADGMPIRGGGSGREDMMLNSIVMREKLTESLRRTQEAVDRVDRALSNLPEADRRILELCYVRREKGAVTRLAAELCVEEKTIYNRKSNALWLFGRALNGIC